MNMKLTAACGCNMGKIRKNNEDNFYFQGIILPQENIGLENILYTEQSLKDAATVFGVFDGMGGEADGQIASYISSNVLSKYLGNLTLYPTKSKKNYEHMIQQMNNAVCKEAEVRFNRMGCTASMLMFFENRVYLCNIGDSPIFRFRDDVLQQISVDHTDAEMLKKQGITKRKPHLTQCIGISPEEMQIQPYFYEEKTCTGDRYLICSDGLTDMVSKEDIAETLSELEDIEECVKCLVQKALDGGGRDNITVLLIDIKEGEVSECSAEKLIPILRTKTSPQRIEKKIVREPAMEEKKREPEVKKEEPKQTLKPLVQQPAKNHAKQSKTKAAPLLALLALVGVGVLGALFFGGKSEKEKPETDTKIEVTTAPGVSGEISVEVTPEITTEATSEVTPEVSAVVSPEVTPEETITEVPTIVPQSVKITDMDFNGDGTADFFEYRISEEENGSIVYVSAAIGESGETYSIPCTYPLTQENIVVSCGNLVGDQYSVVVQFVDEASSYHSAEYHVFNLCVEDGELIMKEVLTILDKNWESELFKETYFELGFGAIQSVSKDELITKIEALDRNGIRIRQAREAEDTADNEVFVYWSGDHWEVYGSEAYLKCISLHGDWNKDRAQELNIKTI